MGLAVLATGATIYLALAWLLHTQGLTHDAGAPWFWQPELAMVIGVGTPVLVGLGSLFKLLQLSRGGGVLVAESLGGRPLTREGADRYERRALNVVEEMALASGTPVPPVYVMDEEDSINAFAAGYSESDAVIGLTRGTIESLTRDELQGVVAHEFSHILHGDMRLNIRLIGIVSGLLIIHGMGRVLLRVRGRTRMRRSERGDNQAMLMLIGLVLWLVGGIGALFATLIKASVSRQREFLADASAVQYTRNPQGIADALKAIGGHSMGAAILHPGADEVSHMFFGSGVKSFFATHPPLPERIQRIEPSWDGAFPKVEARTIDPDAKPRRRPQVAEAQAAALLSGDGITPPAASLAHAVMAAGGVEGVEPLPSRALTEAIEHLGTLTDAHVERARQLRRAIPEPLLELARTSYGARAVVYGFLIQENPSVAQGQRDYLAEHAETGMVAETARVLPLLKALPVESRLPLAEITLGALRTLSVSQLRAFAKHVSSLERMDDHTSLFEWLLRRLVERQIVNASSRPKTFRAGRYKLRQLSENCSRVLSAQAYASHRDPEVVKSAFVAGAELLKGRVEIELLPRDRCRPEHLDIALLSLDQVLPKNKKELLVACCAIATEDGVVKPAEVELLRALAAALSCPMPPLILTPTQSS